MLTKLTPGQLDYASRAPDGGHGCHIATRWLARHPAIAALALLFLTVWIGTYLYFRAWHSLGGVYASAPVAWKQINYDEHYPWAKPLFYLHQPLAWLDQHFTGTEIQMWKIDFHGNRDNYGLEAFN
jgi:hypothetical protein